MKNLEGWLYMLLGALLNGGASILLKHAAVQSQTGQARLLFMAIALLCYGGAFGLYYLALRQVEVGTAYLVMTAIAAIVVSLYGHFGFGDAFGAHNWAGAILILLGIALMVRAQPL